MTETVFAPSIVRSPTLLPSLRWHLLAVAGAHPWLGPPRKAEGRTYDTHMMSEIRVKIIRYMIKMYWGGGSARTGMLLQDTASKRVPVYFLHFRAHFYITSLFS